MDASDARALSKQDGAGVSLPWTDIVISSAASIALVYLLTGGRWIPGWETAVVTFAAMALGPPVLRALSRRWPGALGLVLWRTRRREFEPFTTALALLFVANFVGYILVPAIGPRMFLSHEFLSPLPGTLTPWLESLMREPAFMKDCLPSGHMATTLLALSVAWKHARKFFWVMLPVGTGLIAATLVERFHYGVDVLCAVPFTFAVARLSAILVQARPRGFLVNLPGFAVRQPLRA